MRELAEFKSRWYISSIISCGRDIKVRGDAPEEVGLFS